MIWTTKKIKELILNDFENVKVYPNMDILEVEFLKKGMVYDVVILEYNENYKNFLTTYKNKGFDGYVIICDFKKGNTIAINTLNVLILDINSLGVEGAKQIISFIVNCSLKKIMPYTYYQTKNVFLSSDSNTEKITIKESILEKILQSYNEKLNVIISIPVYEDGRQVSARGTGYIKSVNNDFVTLEKIKPVLLTTKIKIDSKILINFLSKDFVYESYCLVKGIKDDTMIVSLPEELVLERRKYVRVEPNRRNPVYIYLHIPGEENEILECIDISIFGTSIATERDLQVLGVYTLGIKTPYDDRFIICEGVVKNKIFLNEKIRVGFELQMSEKDTNIIADYIRKREIEILELLRKSDS